MQFPNKQELERLRRVYTPGTVIRLIEMADDPYPISAGSIGEVEYVDDAGNIHMKWKNGGSLSLIDGVDRFTVLKNSS